MLDKKISNDKLQTNINISKTDHPSIIEKSEIRTKVRTEIMKELKKLREIYSGK